MLAVAVRGESLVWGNAKSVFSGDWTCTNWRPHVVKSRAFETGGEKSTLAQWQGS